MKKIVELLLLLIFLFDFASCNSKSKSPINDLGKQNLTGDVIGLKDGDFFYFFNNKGNIDKAQMYIDNKVVTLVNYIYVDDKLDKVIQKVSNKEYIKIFSYDQNGRLILEMQDDGDDKTYGYKNYNSEGLLIQDSTLYITIRNGVEEKSMNIHNYYYTNGELNRTEFYSEGKENEKMIETFKGGNLIRFEYDSKIFNFEYTNDSKGNWVQSKCIEDGKIKNRIIYYKGQDLSEYEKMYNEFNASISINNNPSTNSENNTIISTDNNSNSSNSINSTSTQNTQEKRKCYSCNGTGKCSKCMKAFRVHYWAGKGPGWKDENETRPGKIMCDDCHGAGVIYGRHPYGEDPEYKKCYVSACNNGWKNCPECNYNGNSNNLGQCQKCKGSGFDR